MERSPPSGGDSGWIATQYVMSEEPARDRLTELLEKANQAGGLTAAVQQELEALKAERDELLGQVAESGLQLDTLGEELTQLKQVSGNALQLDEDNRRLVLTRSNCVQNWICWKPRTSACGTRSTTRISSMAPSRYYWASSSRWWCRACGRAAQKFQLGLTPP